MFQTSPVIPIFNLFVCWFVCYQIVPSMSELDISQSRKNCGSRFAAALNFTKIGFESPPALFFLSVWPKQHFNLHTTLRSVIKIEHSWLWKRIVLHISKEILSAGNQPKYFHVGIRPSDCRLLLENHWATNAVSFNCHFNGYKLKALLVWKNANIA